MSRRTHHINYIFVVLFFVASASSMAMADGEILLKKLHLKTYEAAVGDLSLCQADGKCIKDAKNLKFWFCAAALCDGKDNGKEPITCFPQASHQYTINEQEQLNALICPVIKSPSTETRQAFLSHFPSGTQEELVEYGAYFMALKGSAESCEGYIKNYVGAYGPQWNFEEYKALSGCRILARKDTREQEEKDFDKWFGVVQGSGQCSDINNNEMQNACNTPGAASPVPQ